MVQDVGDRGRLLGLRLWCCELLSSVFNLFGEAVFPTTLVARGRIAAVVAYVSFEVYISINA